MSDTTAGELRRDVQVMGLIGVAHGMSHFYQQVLPPLFGPMKDTFGVSNLELGALMTVSAVASAVGQMAAGFAVDRYGARRLLVAGLAICGTALSLTSLAQAYWHLVLLAVLAGIGNCVFHPADFAILNASVSNKRMGRAYGMHGLLGTLGWPAAIFLMFFLSATLGWRQAALWAGLLGVGMAIVIALTSDLYRDHRAADTSGVGGAPRRGGAPVNWQVMFSAPILMCLLYFVFVAMTGPSVNAFGPQALGVLYDVKPEHAAFAIISYYVGSASGVFVGGWLADRATRHDIVAACGLLGAAAFMGLAAAMIVPLAMVGLIMACAGFCSGCTGPSRDMIVRKAAPTGASGKIFGFVYSGLDIGQAIGPLLFGWFMDNGQPRAIFVAGACMFVFATITVLQVRRLGTAGEPVRA